MADRVREISARLLFEAMTQRRLRIASRGTLTGLILLRAVKQKLRIFLLIDCVPRSAIRAEEQGSNS